MGVRGVLVVANGEDPVGTNFQAFFVLLTFWYEGYGNGKKCKSKILIPGVFVLNSVENMKSVVYGIVIAYNLRRGALVNSPLCLKTLFDKRGKIFKMKFLKFTLISFIMLIGLSIAVVAQTEGDKKNVPEKPKPPVVIVNLDKKNDPKPKENDENEKKPLSFLLSLINRIGDS